MNDCPFCSCKNIEGVDVCEECGQPLTHNYLHEPATEVERSLLNDHIAALEPKVPITVTSDTPVRDVIKTLVERGIGCLMVVDDDELKGIFSERDALVKLNTRAAELGDRPVSEFMTANPQTLEASAKIAFAVQQMDLGGYRHVPIVSEAGKLEGIISVRDILDHLTEKMGA